MLGNNAVVSAPNGDTVALCKAGEGLGHGELDGVVVNLLNALYVQLGGGGAADGVVVHNHVEGEHNVVSSHVLAVGPLNALTDFNGPLGEVVVALGHAVGNLAVLLALGGVHLPQVGTYHLMNAEAHGGAAHVRVELAGSVSLVLALDDKGLGAVSTHLGGYAGALQVCRRSLALAALLSSRGFLSLAALFGIGAFSLRAGAGAAVAAAGREHGHQQGESKNQCDDFLTHPFVCLLRKLCFAKRSPCGRQHTIRVGNYLHVRRGTPSKTLPGPHLCALLLEKPVSYTQHLKL